MTEICCGRAAALLTLQVSSVMMLMMALKAQAWISSTPLLHSHLRQGSSKPFRIHQPLTSSASSVTSDPPSSLDTPPSSSTNSTRPLDYNWKEQWYALTYASYVPNPSTSAETVPAAVFGQPLVLWREEDDGEIYCAADACPHRATALSEGRVRNGTLQCLYHGWQFSGRDNGDCVRIPQLESTATIPKRACLDMKTCRTDEGIVWVWMGDKEPTRGPTGTGVFDSQGKAEGWNPYDFQIDLNYDASFLVENLLDPAHIDISHDRTSGGGKRENARPYEMIIDQDSISPQGFTGRHRQDPDKNYTEFQFEAPGILRQYTESTLPNNKTTICFGAALHCMPLTLGRCRLLFRVYFKGLPAIANFILSLKPMWWRHLNSCLVLEQDVGLIATQEDHFARKLAQQQEESNELKDDYLLIKSSDGYVGAYRTWLDRVGHGMPWFQGLASSAGKPLSHVDGLTALPPGLKAASHRASNQGIVETRYHRHVMHSPTSRNALANIQKLKKLSIALASVSLAGLVLGQSPIRALTRMAKVALPVAGLAATALHCLERQFFVSHKRKDVLRKESGLVP